jgi:ABC-type nitrate/sulfonate/bicarbonate transport system substrate-binding protein
MQEAATKNIFLDIKTVPLPERRHDILLPVFPPPLLVASAMALSLQPAAHATEAAPAEVHLDYAYYSPVSLVLKHFGFLEKALPQTKVSWVLSQGSNRSLEYLNSGGVDFASSPASPPC